MEDRRVATSILVDRLLIAVPVALLAWWLFARGGAGLALLGLVCTVAVGFILGPGIAGLIAEPAGGLFFPQRPARPAPRRSIAEARRARGDYDAAIAAFEEVTDEFPEDVESWIAMVEIAFTHMCDGSRGDALARRALLTLRDDTHRRQLLHVHRVQRRRLTDGH
jgi:hypothetical protein